MKRFVVLFVAVGAVAAISLKARIGADEPSDLEGTWSVVAVSMDGLKATEQIAARFKLTVRETTITIRPGLAVDGNGKIEAGAAEGEEATFTIDRNKSPAEIDLTFGSGSNKMVMKGIYAVEKDELKICYSPVARPGHFANTPGSGETLLLGKRDEP